MTLPHSLDQRKIWASLKLSGWVFTCLWTLGSTSPMMVGPIRLLMHLWWCTHIDSWHVVSWLAYISDLEFWSAFVWSIILVLLCQHSFGDVWSCFSIGSLRLCISFSLHHHEHIPEYLVRWHSVSHVDYYLTLGHTPFLEFIDSLLQTFSLLILSLDLCELSYWGIPPSLSSLTFCWLLSLLDLFLDLYGSSLWGIPFWRFSTRAYPLSLGLPCLVLISWLSDPFVDLYELSPRAPPTISFFKASPYYHLV